MLDIVDGVLFAFAGASAVWLAYLLLKEGISPGWQSLLLIRSGSSSPNLMLPRLHRILTRICASVGEESDYFTDVLGRSQGWTYLVRTDGSAWQMRTGS